MSLHWTSLIILYVRLVLVQQTKLTPLLPTVMITAAEQTKQSNSQQHYTNKSYIKSFIFVLQLIDGRYVVGQANNPCKRIAALNSGNHHDLPKALQVYRVVGIKEQGEDRTFIGVVKKMCDKHGTENVLCV